jgi:hypothetical protein
MENLIGSYYSFINAFRDVSNCGYKGNQCTAENGYPLCSEGTCGLSCYSGFHEADGKCYEYNDSGDGYNFYKTVDPLTVMRMTVEVAGGSFDLSVQEKFDGEYYSVGYADAYSIEYTNCGALSVPIRIKVNNENLLSSPLYINTFFTQNQTTRSRLCGEEEEISDALVSAKVSEAVYDFERDHEDAEKYKQGTIHGFSYDMKCVPFKLEARNTVSWTNVLGNLTQLNWKVIKLITIISHSGSLMK